MRTSTFRFAAAAVLTTGIVALATQPAHARKNGGALVMTSFVQNGRHDVFRNEPLVFKFSVALNRRSIDDRTIRVMEVTGTGAKSAVGARIQRGNRVIFDPERSQRNYDASKLPNSTVTEKDHTSGFTSFQDFIVELPAAPNDLHVLKGSRGQPNERFFAGTFRTNGAYIDPVPGQPYFVGDHGTGLLGFDPPKSGATGLVDADAVVILEFSEPILIDTLDPASTVIVKRVTVGEQVPGYIKADPNEPTGRRFMFVPSVGFGSDNANLQGWDIGITLTTGITDLAGNALKRPVTLPIFRTRYVPNAPSCSLVTETFANGTYNATTVTDGGEWNTLKKGSLVGGFPTSYTPVDMIYTVANTGVSGLVRIPGGFQEPLVGATVPPGNAGGGCIAYPNGARLQQLYVPGDLGRAAAVVSVGWGPSSNALFAGNYPELTIEMGHTSAPSLGADYAGNINIGSPLRTYQGPYAVPQAKNIKPTDFPQDSSGVTHNPYATGMWLYPIFSAPFEFNNVNNLVIDWQAQGGDNCQIMRAAFVPGGIPFPQRRAFGHDYQGATSAFAPDAVIYDTQFRMRRRATYAVSSWYQVASDNPVFAAPVVSPVGQPGGVSILFEMEGAYGKPDPFNAGLFIADPTTGTGWTTTYSKVDGHRFFRFKITMYANLTTNQVASIDSIQFPYCF
jgi:hypothetical protein